MERDAFRDDPLLQAVVARLAAGGDEAAAEVLEALIERLRVEAIGAVMETLPPSRPMDYPARPIRLVVSSSEIGVRLLSAEKEPFTVEWIEKSIKPGDVFYDIGANVGSYALIAAKSTDNRARVFAFEPSPSSFLDLSRNVALNGCADSVTPLPLALWSHNELLSLAARPTVGGTPSRPNVAGAAEHRIGPAAGDQGSVPIIGVPLDDLVERLGLPVPTHAKIDTDGYELEVLRGAKRTLVRREWRSIILELDRDHTSRNEQIRSFLAERGFVTERLHERLPSPAFPDPASRPDVYCTFSRQSPVQPRRPPRIGRPGRSRTTIQAAQRRAVTLTLAVITALFLLLVFLPEELGDRPYDVFGLRF